MDKPRHRALSSNPLKRYIADPGAMGLFAFAVVTFMSGAIHCGWRTRVDKAMFAPAMAYGGLVQVIAGIIDLIRGEKVSGSTFVAFGFYWFSRGMMMWPGVRPEDTYPERTEFDAAIGFYLIGWSFVAFATTLAMLRTTWAQILLLSMVTLDFTGLAIVSLHPNRTFETVVGYSLVATALLAWYVGTAFLLKDKSGMKLPLFVCAGNEDEDDPSGEIGRVKSVLAAQRSDLVVHEQRATEI